MKELVMSSVWMMPVSMCVVFVMVPCLFVV